MLQRCNDEKFYNALHIAFHHVEVQASRIFDIYIAHLHYSFYCMVYTVPTRSNHHQLTYTRKFNANVTFLSTSGTMKGVDSKKNDDVTLTDNFSNIFPLNDSIF